MKRRKTIKLLGLAIPFTSTGLILTPGCNSFQKSDRFHSELFTNSQCQLVSRITDIIIPKTDTPSASEVGVLPRIEDQLVSNYTAKMTSHFISGLQFIEDMCMELYGNKSSNCSIREITNILDIIIQNNNANNDLDIHPFYPLLKGLTVSAFFTSEIMQLYFRKKANSLIL